MTVNRCIHVAFISDNALTIPTLVACKGLSDGPSLQSMFGQYSFEKQQGGVPNPLESKAAIISAWCGLVYGSLLDSPWLCTTPIVGFESSWTRLIFWKLSWQTRTTHSRQRDHLRTKKERCRVCAQFCFCSAWRDTACNGAIWAEWNRVGWTAVLARWPHNMACGVILPAPFDESGWYVARHCHSPYWKLHHRPSTSLPPNTSNPLENEYSLSWICLMQNFTLTMKNTIQDTAIFFGLFPSIEQANPSLMSPHSELCSFSLKFWPSTKRWPKKYRQLEDWNVNSLHQIPSFFWYFFCDCPGVRLEVIVIDSWS